MQALLELWKQSPAVIIAGVFVLVGIIIPAVIFLLSSKTKCADSNSEVVPEIPSQEMSNIPILLDYQYCVQPGQSVLLLEKESNELEKSGDKQALALSLGNLALAQICLGEFEEAGINLKYGIRYSRENQNSSLGAVLSAELGRLLAYQGEFEQAYGEFDLALNTFEKQNDLRGQGTVLTYRGLSAMLDGDYPGALDMAQKASEVLLKDKVHTARDIVQAKCLLGATYRGAGKLGEAHTYLQEAFAKCRSAELVEFEAAILLELARLHREEAVMLLPREEQEDVPAKTCSSSNEPCACELTSPKPSDKSTNEAIMQAYDFAYKALELAKERQYRLQEADIHLLLVQLAIDVGDEGEVLQEADAAYERASCGYQTVIEAADMYKKLMTIKTGCSCSH